MNAKEASKIVIDGSSFRLENNKPYTLLELIDESIKRNNRLYNAKGYLEAHEKAQVLVEAVKGLSFGVDWNKGTHAKLYRPKLLKALAEYEEEA